MTPYLRMLAIVVAASLVLWGLERRWRTLSNFFCRRSSALNLAAVRVAVLAAIWLEIRNQRVFTFARLEPALLAPPKGWGFLAPLLPRSQNLMEILYAAFLISAAFALIGLYTRLALVLTATASGYLLTIPQLFGKVDHYHHLVIFCFLLALYPAADTLSVDSLRKALKAADQGYFPRPIASRAYAEGLNSILILMALMYFFPGTWKIAGSWHHWFSSENMAFLIYKRMLEIDTTPIRMLALHTPLALLVSTYAAVCFELSMIFLILWRQSRPVALLLGLAFHNLTGVMMAIRFMALQFCYAALVDWTALFELLAERWKLGPITVVYDPHCRLCRRTIGVLCNLDWLGRLNLLPNTRVAELDNPMAIASVDTAEGMTFAALDGTRRIELGYDAYILIASRIVAFWPVRIVMALGVIRRFGRALYNRVAWSRTCDTERRGPEPEVKAIEGRISPGARIFVGTCLTVMVLTGMAHLVNGWPFACYPTFDGPPTLVISELELKTVDRQGKSADYTLSYDPTMEDLLGSGRWDALLQQQIRAGAAPNPSAAALIRLWQDTHHFGEIADATFSVESYVLDLDTFTLKLVGQNQLTTLSSTGGI